MPARSMRKRPFANDTEVANARNTRGRMLLGYARVSKGDEQNNALQAKALRAAGCRKLFEEAASGGRWDRPELHHARSAARGRYRHRQQLFVHHALQGSQNTYILIMARRLQVRH